MPEPPEWSLLRARADGATALRWGGYCDAYVAVIPRRVAISEYVFAFYTTPVFRLERLVIRVLADRPSTDADVLALATGASDRFAVWRVIAHDAMQILLEDDRAETRSWLAVRARGDGSELHFGSGIATRTSPATGREELSSGYRRLLPFHRFYSRILLRAAARLLA